MFETTLYRRCWYWKLVLASSVFVGVAITHGDRASAQIAPDRTLGGESSQVTSPSAGAFQKAGCYPVLPISSAIIPSSIFHALSESSTSFQLNVLIAAITWSMSCPRMGEYISDPLKTRNDVVIRVQGVIEQIVGYTPLLAPPLRAEETHLIPCRESPTFRKRVRKTHPTDSDPNLARCQTSI